MLISSILVLLISNAVSSRRDKSILYSRIAMIIMASCFILCINGLDLKFIDKGLGLFGGLYHTTVISHVFQLFIFFITFFILQLNSFYPRKILIEQEQSGSLFKLLFSRLEYFNSFILNKMSEQYRIIEYPLIILFAVMGGVFLMSSCDLISVFLSIELQSYALYILCATYRNSERATSGALTYFLLGGLSSCFILLASSILYGNSGNTGFDGLFVISNISNANVTMKETIQTTVASLYQSNYINFALTVMSVGFLFKVGAAPFHFWSPDVYDAVPTIVTTFIATFAKITIFVLLLELVHYTSNLFVSSEETQQLLGNYENSSTNISWTFTLLISSFFSLIIGGVLGLTQFRIKRLYAYSTISHLGFILLALTINSIESIQCFIFYLMQYSITNLNAFIILIAIGYCLYLFVENKSDYNDSDNYVSMEERLTSSNVISDRNNSPIQLITEIKGFFYINPVLSISLAITLFSFVGVPPLIGFFGKQMVLTCALDNGYVFMALIAILTSVISAYYYLVLVKEIFFSKSNYVLNPELKNINVKVNYTGKGLLTGPNASLISNHSNQIPAYYNNIHLSSSLTSMVSILTLMILLFMFAPQEWLNITTIITLIIFNS